MEAGGCRRGGWGREGAGGGGWGEILGTSATRVNVAEGLCTGCAQAVRRLCYTRATSASSNSSGLQQWVERGLQQRVRVAPGLRTG